MNVRKEQLDNTCACMHFPQANNFFQNRKAPCLTAIQQNKINDLLNYKLKEELHLNSIK